VPSDATVEPESILSSLAAAGVVHDDGEEVTLTESFRGQRAEIRETIAGEDDSPVSSSVETALQAAATEVDRELRATAGAVAAATGLEPEAVAGAALALGRIEEPAPTHGVPDGFTPIRGEEIAAFLERHPTAIVYVWGDDCEPCEAVRSDLEEMQERGTIPDSMGLAAVYGDQCQQLLGDRFDVTVAPTTLFCAGGRVDSRLIGAHHQETLASEIEIIANE